MLLRHFTTGLIALALVACSSTGTKPPATTGVPIDYKNSNPNKTSNTLEVPPDLTAPSLDERRGVLKSETGTSLSDGQIGRAGDNTNAPVRATLSDPATGMRIVRAGSQRWLVVPKTTTETLWPQVRQFLQDSGFNIDKEYPALLVMQTDWSENRAAIPNDLIRRMTGRALDAVYDSNTRDRYRVRLEPGYGADAGSVEVYISQAGMEAVYTPDTDNSGTVWIPRANDPGLEAEMLTRLMIVLGVKEEVARERVAAAGNAPQNATISTEAGVTYLKIKAGIDRGWRQVGLSLDRVGVVVEDRDRAKGYYQVRYVANLSTDKQKSSWTDGIAFWRKEPDSKTNVYRVVVTGDVNQTTVQVLNSEGAPDNSPSARQILTLLQEQMR